VIVKVITALCMLVGAGFVGGGVWELHQQDTGMKVVATVSECHVDSGGSTHATTTCSGSWIQGGSLLNNGHVVLGTIDGVGSGDVGKNVKARVHGGTAFAHSLRLPIVLFAIGGVMVLFGVWFLWALATGRAYGTPKTRAAASAV
jgi:hypothetical protein